MRPFLFAYLLLIAPHFLSAQKLWIEPSVGFFLTGASSGFYKLEDVVVVPLGPDRSDNLIFGLTIGMPLTPKLSWRNSFNYFSTSQTVLVYNAVEVCTFCPLKMYRSLVKRVIGITPALSYSLIKRDRFSISALAGVETQFQSSNSNQQDYNWGTKRPGVQEVLNNLNSSVKPVVFYYQFGGIVSYGRFSFSVSRTNLLSKSYTSSIPFQGNKYPFYNKDAFLRFILSYRIEFKRHEKKDLE
jgi:hypothetical protein